MIYFIFCPVVQVEVKENESVQHIALEFCAKYSLPLKLRDRLISLLTIKIGEYLKSKANLHDMSRIEADDKKDLPLPAYVPSRPRGKSLAELFHLIDRNDKIVEQSQEFLKNYTPHLSPIVTQATKESDQLHVSQCNIPAKVSVSPKQTQKPMTLQEIAAPYEIVFSALRNKAVSKNNRLKHSVQNRPKIVVPSTSKKNVCEPTIVQRVASKSTNSQAGPLTNIPSLDRRLFRLPIV